MIALLGRLHEKGLFSLIAVDEVRRIIIIQLRVKRRWLIIHHPNYAVLSDLESTDLYLLTYN